MERITELLNDTYYNKMTKGERSFTLIHSSGGIWPCIRRKNMDKAGLFLLADVAVLSCDDLAALNNEGSQGNCTGTVPASHATLPIHPACVAALWNRYVAEKCYTMNHFQTWKATL